MHFDAIVIGAGMSGMACAIRLAMSGKKVVLLESHRISGGLNSFYQRGKRKFDVGLHALTNFALPGTKGSPLLKLLRQLRIRYDDWQLAEQSFSAITFDQKRLHFANQLSVLRQHIGKEFPDEIVGFDRLVEYVQNLDDVALTGPFISAREKIHQFIKNDLLCQMIFCPLQFYGSSWQHDMDVRQMATMFKALYLEGFARPLGGVRTIISSLEKRLQELAVEVRFNHPVEQILTKDERVIGVISRSLPIFATQIYSSAGLIETTRLLPEASLPNNPSMPVGELSFCETLMHFPIHAKSDQPLFETINFYSQKLQFDYKAPKSSFNDESAVICFPNNYKKHELLEAQVRVTFLANYKLWKELSNDRPSYLAEKKRVLAASFQLVQKLYPKIMPLKVEDLSFSDVFTPTTVKHYTGHLQGAIYGSPVKLRDGKMPIENLFVIGTDQGFLGIVGALLSGITIANIYGVASVQNSNQTEVDHATGL